MIEVRVLGIDAVQDRLRQVASDLQPKVLGPAINQEAEKARAGTARGSHSLGCLPGTAGGCGDVS